MNIEEIKKALSAKGAKGPITGSSDFRALGIDSLDLMDMIVALEDKLNVTFSDEQLMSIKTVNDLLKAVEEVK